MWRTLAWFCRRAFSAAPVLSGLTVALSLILAALPGAQVLVLAALIRALDGANRILDLAGTLLALVLIVGLTPTLTSINQSVQHRGSQRLQAELNADLVHQAARISPRELVGSSSSAQVERHSRAIGEGVCRGFTLSVRAVGALLSSVGIIAAVFTFSAVAGVLTLLAMGPPLLYSRHMSRVWEREWEEVAPLYDRERYLRDLVVRARPATELAALGTSARIADMVAARWRAIDRIMSRSLWPRILGSIGGDLVSTVLLGGAIVSVILGVHFQAASVAGIYGVLAAMSASAGAGLDAGTVIESVPSTRSLREFLAEDRRARTASPAPPVRELSVEGLTHRYEGRHRDAVRGISLHAERGEVIALVGVNGAGKTTTVNAILGLLDPVEGTVSADRRTLGELGEDAWFARFGLLTQEFGRFELTVREAVQLGTMREDVTDAQLWAALRAANAETMVQDMPEGLDTQLGEAWGGVGISGGQWQRLALARIHLRGAPIWILDEPTSAIDAEAEQEVFAELQRSRSERITVVVSHRAWTLRGMDRIYVFDDGRIVEQGTFESLQAKNGRFVEIFAQQS